MPQLFYFAEEEVPPLPRRDGTDEGRAEKRTRAFLRAV